MRSALGARVARWSGRCSPRASRWRSIGARRRRRPRRRHRRRCSRRSADRRCRAPTPCRVGWPVLRVLSASRRSSPRLVAGLLPALRAASRRIGSRARGHAEHGQPRRAAAPRRRGHAADCADGRAARRRGAPDSHGAEPDHVRPGYDTENILALTVTAVQRDQWKDFHTQALERVAAIPGVRHVAFAWGVPLTGNNWPGDMEILGAAGPRRLAERSTLPLRAVTPDYFAVMGMRLAEGRDLPRADDDEAPRVAIDQRGVRAALLRRIERRSAARFGSPATPSKPIEIVGVVSDTRTDDAERARRSRRSTCRSGRAGAFSKHLVVRTTRRSARRSRRWCGASSRRSIRPRPSSTSRRWRRFGVSRSRRGPSRCAC